MKDSEHQNGYELLAWCGWSLPIPPRFEPIRIDGGWDRGEMMLGIDNTPVALVKWWRPRDKKFEPDKWLARRFRALGAPPDDSPSTPDGFSAVGWLENLQRKQGCGKTIWYGCSSEAKLVVECISTSEVDAGHRRTFFEELLPNLKATPTSETMTWSVFSAHFQSPTGFKLSRHRLLLGDIALEMRDDVGQCLTLRQVFPATLAMQRRSLERWLDHTPFMERRQMRKARTTKDDACITQSGWKRLPSPMGWLKPRYCHRVARVENDRLHLAESQTRRAADVNVVEEAVSAMLIDRKAAT